MDGGADGVGEAEPTHHPLGARVGGGGEPVGEVVDTVGGDGGVD